MKNITQLIFKPKKNAVAKGVARAGTIWFDNDDQDEIDALSTLAIKKAGFKRNDFFKPVRVDHLVVDDMPAEGVFDTAFCERYRLADNGKSWLLPAAQPESAAATSTDSGTATTPHSNVNVNGEPMTEVEKGMDWPAMDLPLPVRWVSQRGMDDKVLTLKPAEREQLAKILEDENNSQYLTNIKEITASEMAPEIDKLTLYHLYRLVTAFDRVSEKVERMGPFMAKRFVRAWLDTEYIDQGVLVNEWCAGRHVSRLEKPTPTSVSDVTEKQNTKAAEDTESSRPRRSDKPTYRTINYEIGCALYEGELDLHTLRPAMDFAKRVIAEGREDWKRWSASLCIIPNIRDYDRQTIIDVVRKAPVAVHKGNPDLRRTWCESFLAIHGVRDPDWYEHAPDKAPATHEENSETVRRAGKCLRDIEAGRFQSEEETQPTEVLADEQAAAETMGQDSTEHHQNPQQVETETRVTTDSEEVRNEKVSEQLAAGRGDFVPGTSDSSDSKWVHNDYSASNEGEKTEVATDNSVNTTDATDAVDHSEDFSNPSEPVADQNEPETPKTEPVTKIADGVFDTSVFFAGTSNQVEKAGNAPHRNDVLTTQQAAITHQDNENERALASVPAEGFTSEVVLLQQANQTLLQILASQLRIEQNHRKNAAAIKGMLAMIYDAETDEGITHGE
ncbi:hypothetical protein PZO74_001956 [Salmonella enterica]|nr:hypothetical protein [Salmonella enterica]